MVQRHLLGWGWQSNKIDSDIGGFQAGWFKGALRQKGPLYFKTIVAKLLWRGKQTFACVLEIECSSQMTFHLPVSWCISIRYVSVLTLGKESFSYLGFSLVSISREISLSLEDVLTKSNSTEHGAVKRKNRSMQGRRLRKGEISAICFSFLEEASFWCGGHFKRHDFSCTNLKPFILWYAEVWS